MASTSTSRIRRWWSEEEDQILRREASIQLRQGAVKDWNGIAVKLPGRTNKDCRKRWSKVSEPVNKGAWSGDEDARLLSGVEQYGLRWTCIAQVVGTRHAEQCAKRWQYGLDPALDHNEWTSAEDKKLQDALGTYGRNWKMISEKVLPTRSSSDIKNRHALLDRRRRQPQGATSSKAATEDQGPTILGLNHEMNFYAPSNASAPLTAKGLGKSSTSITYSSAEDSLNHSALADYSSNSALSFAQCMPTEKKHLQSSLSSVDSYSHTHYTSTETSNEEAEHSSLAAESIMDCSEWDDSMMIFDPQTKQDPPHQHLAFDSPPEHLQQNSTANYIPGNSLSAAGLMQMGDGSGLGPHNPGRVRSSLLIEDIQPETLSCVMNALCQSRTKVKMTLVNNGD